MKPSREPFEAARVKARLVADAEMRKAGRKEWNSMDIQTYSDAFLELFDEAKKESDQIRRER